MCQNLTIIFAEISKKDSLELDHCIVCTQEIEFGGNKQVFKFSDIWNHVRTTYVQQNFIHHDSTNLYHVQSPKYKNSFSKIKFVKLLTVKVMFELHNFVVNSRPYPWKIISQRNKCNHEIPQKVWMTFFFHFKCSNIAQREKIYSLFQTWNLARKILIFFIASYELSSNFIQNIGHYFASGSKMQYQGERWILQPIFWYLKLVSYFIWQIKAIII